MVLSMTGYGQSSTESEGKTYRFEIKSLNGKTSDIRFKSNSSLMEKELELRRIVLDKGMRGKFDASLNIENVGGSEDSVFNIRLMKSYFTELKAFSDEFGIKEGDMLQSLIRLPNIVQLTEGKLSDKEWLVIKTLVIDAVDQLNEFRAKEGQSLYLDATTRAKSIRSLLQQITPFEEERIVNLKERIKKNLNTHLGKENIDENRFEQEIIFYLEKLDINEERVRLDQHCKYFLEQIDNKETLKKGKKLSFIAQEMGREINTLGAKAQHSEIQQIVVGMKDELEKIKEQLLNIL